MLGQNFGRHQRTVDWFWARCCLEKVGRRRRPFNSSLRDCKSLPGALIPRVTFATIFPPTHVQSSAATALLARQLTTGRVMIIANRLAILSRATAIVRHNELLWLVGVSFLRVLWSRTRLLVAEREEARFHRLGCTGRFALTALQRSHVLNNLGRVLKQRDLLVQELGTPRHTR